MKIETVRNFGKSIRREAIKTTGSDFLWFEVGFAGIMTTIATRNVWKGFGAASTVLGMFMLGNGVLSAVVEGHVSEEKREQEA